jgi:UPF0716 protein FxsA
VAALVLIVLVAIAELYVIVQVAHHIGVVATIGLLVLFCASGPWLVRRTGLGVWRRAKNRLDQGDLPGRELVDGALLLAAGVLLTVPGFITGVLGLLLLIPPVRAFVRLLGGRWLARRVVVRRFGAVFGGRGGVVISAASRPVPDGRRAEARAALGGPTDDGGEQVPGAPGGPVGRPGDPRRGSDRPGPT